jgi:hypothetical protein
VSASGDGTDAGAGTRPTIRDVARLAGVSPMTVSRVINGGQSVQPQTAAKVERRELILRTRFISRGSEEISPH